MNVVLLGPPGAGKGTQAMRISETFSLRHLSSGDVLRSERKKGTELGQRVSEYMDSGRLVPDEIIVEVILSELNDPGGAAGFLLDGFPRTEAQACSLDKVMEVSNCRIDLALSLEVADEVIVNRITGRRICPNCDAVYHVQTFKPVKEGFCDNDGTALIQRGDDTEQVVKERLSGYHRQTKPLEDYYLQTGRLEVLNGGQSVDAVFSDVSAVIQNRLGNRVS
ncbi:MAG: adenylate kinase [Planctomycetota bacterium]|jgi:adenylate kinase